MAIRSKKALFLLCCVSAFSTVIFYTINHKSLSYAILQRAVLSDRTGFSNVENYADKFYSSAQKELSDIKADEDEHSGAMYNEDEDDDDTVIYDDEGENDDAIYDDEDENDDAMNDDENNSNEVVIDGDKDEAADVIYGDEDDKGDEEGTDNDMYDDDDDGYDDDIAGDEDVETLISDYEDGNGRSKMEKDAIGDSSDTEVLADDTVSQTQAKDDAGWYQSIEARFNNRLQRVRDVCKKYNNPGYRESYTKSNLLYYSTQYNIMVCLCAKVGTSTWKSHLLHMKGNDPVTNNIHTDYWESKIRAKNILGYTLDRRIKSSTMVMTSRHPLDRLVSAFRDKFCDGKPVDEPQSSAHYKYFWKPAMRALHKGRTSGKLQITFIEFLKYVVIDQSKTYLGDRHFGRFHRMCSVCKFRYDYIMKLETYTEDLASIKHKFNITELNVFDRRHAKSDSKLDVSFETAVEEVSSPTATSISYFLTVPPDLLNKILNIYKVDLEMFGYVVPTPLKDLIEKGVNVSGKDTTLIRT